MRAYNKVQMLRLVNMDLSLSEVYLANIASEGTIDDALQKTFLEAVVGTYLAADYDELFKVAPEEIPACYIPDSEIVAELKALIAKHGWRIFADGLYHLSKKKAALMRVLGFDSSSWDAIMKRFKGLRKTVQL